MISALEGWQFVGPKGLNRIRQQDHALLQPMFQVRLRTGQRTAAGSAGEDVLAGQPAAAGHAVQVAQRVAAPIQATPSRTSGLGLDIGGATIVADVSLEVREGELLGIIGPNGAGKTSLFNLLSGPLPADRGPRRARRARRHRAAAAPPRARRARAARSRSRASSHACRCSRTCGSPPRRGSAGRCGSGAARRACTRRSSAPGRRSRGSGSRRALRRPRVRSRTGTSGSSSSRCSSRASRA